MFDRRLMLPFLALLSLSACDSFVSVGEAIRDDDGDSWFTNATNQRVTLTLEAIGVQRGGTYFVRSEGIHLPLSSSLDASVPIGDGTIFQWNLPLTTRTIGTWLLDAENQVLSFATPLQVVRNDDPSVTFSRTVTWTNQPGTFEVAMNSGTESVVVRLAVSVQQFADPSPTDPNGDSDRDGISDIEEAAISARGIPAGDPARRDIIIAIGYTHPEWALTPLSRELLLTQFQQRGINLYIVDRLGDPFDLVQPGLVAGMDRDDIPPLPVVRGRRPLHVFSHARNYVHWCMLVKRPMEAEFGVADGRQNIVCRSHLYGLGPDAFHYQAKDVMHELGHNLGLCHPETVPCPSGTLPPPERNSAASVMGSPAEATDLVDLVEDAWSRPLDYTPTQWANVDLTRVRPATAPQPAPPPSN